MSTATNTNNCIADIASANASISIAKILALPFSGESCSRYSRASSAIDRLQHTIIGPSFNIPDHPGLSCFGCYIIKANALSGRYSVSVPDVQTHLYLQVGISIAVLVGVIFATILYTTLLNSEKKKPPLRKAILGSTLLLTSIFLPYAYINAMGTQSTTVRFAPCCLFAVYMFRILESMFGFVPRGATSSLGIYCTYFSLPFEMMFDEKTYKPIMATKQDILKSQIDVVKSVAYLLTLCSILSPYGYTPFGETSAGEFNEKIVVKDYLDAKHLGNCFAIALFFQQGLALADAAVRANVQMILGYKAKQVMRNPVLEATSPSDFWGRRWNLLVHSAMKRGVYKPVRRYSSSGAVASLAVFVASGLIHEWLVHIVFLYNRPSASSSEVLLGSNIAFFVWNFVVVVSEKLLAGTKGIKSLRKMVPPTLIPFLIVMTSLPVAHWFGNPYLKGGYFADYDKVMFLIRKA